MSIGSVGFESMASDAVSRTYAAAQGIQGRGLGLREASTRERLVAQRNDLTRRVADIDAALKLLDEIPKVEELLNALGRVSY